MQKSFPTIAVFQESAKFPLNHLGSVLMSLGVFVLGAIIATVLAAVIMLASGFDLANAEALLQSMQSGQVENLGSAGGILLAFLAMLVVILGSTSHVFNYWVNLSAYGSQAASWSFSDGRGKAMMVNAFKLLFIGILVSIVGIVITLVLSAVGLSPSLAEQASSDAVTQYREGLAASIIVTVSYCIIYSLFSANLTYTALQSTAEGMEHPYVMDFSIVLIMLYALFVIPSAIAAFIDSSILFWAIQIILGLFITFAIPAAHGVRYRFCSAQIDPIAPEIPSDED